MKRLRFGRGTPQEQPPTRCECGKKLRAPEHIKYSWTLPIWHPLHKYGGCYTECSCGVIYIWSFTTKPGVNGEWKKTHTLELLRPVNRYSRNPLYLI